MRKSIPVLLTVFALFFAGKSLKKNNERANCGPTISFSNGSGSIPVTSVVVQNLNSGNTTTYNNPTFPFNHVDEGYQFKVTYYFSGNYSGSFWFGAPCQVTHFYNQGLVEQYFDAYCDYYYVTITPDPNELCE